MMPDFTVAQSARKRRFAAVLDNENSDEKLLPQRVSDGRRG
jgi:hypothetical protein